MDKFVNEIEAIQWIGNNLHEIRDTGCNVVSFNPKDKSIIIKNLKGEHTGSLGDWIVKSIKGEFYFCKPDIFKSTYDLTEQEKEKNQ